MSVARLFQPLTTLPSDLTPAAVQVARFCGAFIHPSDMHFDWSGFKKRLDAGIDDLSYDIFKNTNISFSEPTVSKIVDTIVAFLKDALHAALGAETLELLTRNTTVALASGSGMTEYLLLFAPPMGDLPTFFYSLVTTITLTVGRRPECYAEVTAMELVVQKGFKDPVALII